MKAKASWTIGALAFLVFLSGFVIGHSSSPKPDAKEHCLYTSFEMLSAGEDDASNPACQFLSEKDKTNLHSLVSSAIYRDIVG